MEIKRRNLKKYAKHAKILFMKVYIKKVTTHQLSDVEVFVENQTSKLF